MKRLVELPSDVIEARAAISMDSVLEWGTPVLYMHSATVASSTWRPHTRNRYRSLGGTKTRSVATARPSKRAGSRW
jgi:hypothetical protein